MKDVLDIHRELLSRGVPHEVVRLPRAIASAEEIPDATGLPPERCVVVRHYLADDALVAVVAAARTNPRVAAILAATGAHSLAPAPADLVNRKTDYALALAAPLLLPPDVSVLMDMTLLQQDVVYIPTGDSGTIVGIPSVTLAAEADARLVDLDGAAVTTVDLDAHCPPELSMAGRRAHVRG